LKIMFWKKNRNDFRILSKDQSYIFSIKELQKRSYFFQTFFQSTLCKDEIEKRCLSLSDTTSDIIDVHYLAVIMKLLHNVEKEAVTSLQIENCIFKRVGLIPGEHNLFGSKKFRKWMLNADSLKIQKLLTVCDYFQILNIVKYHGFNIANISKTDLQLALKILSVDHVPQISQLYDAALKVACCSFIECKKLLNHQDKLLDLLIQERVTKTQVCGIFRVDTSFDDRKTFCNHYVIVAFGPNAPDNDKWEPTIVAQFFLDNDERVTQAVNSSGYIYVLTTQFDKEKNETKIRVHRFNPYLVVCYKEQEKKENFSLLPEHEKIRHKRRPLKQVITLSKKKPKKNNFDRGWFKEPCKLKKHGFVDHIHAEIHSFDQKEYICLRYWTRTNRMVGSSDVVSPLPLTDADRFDLVNKKWSKCNYCQKYKKKFKGPETLSQVLNLKGGLVCSTIKKSYQHYATQQEFFRRNDRYLVKSIKVVYPELPVSNCNTKPNKVKANNISDIIKARTLDSFPQQDIHIGVFYRILMDQSYIDGSHRIQLTQYDLGDPSQRRVLYALDYKSDENEEKDFNSTQNIEHILRNSNLAIPDIINLSSNLL